MSAKFIKDSNFFVREMGRGWRGDERLKLCICVTVLCVDSWFQTSVRCLDSLSKECHSSEVVDDIVDSLLRPHLTLFELCTRRNLYEGQSAFH